MNPRYLGVVLWTALLTVTHSAVSDGDPNRRYALVWSRLPGAEACPDGAALQRDLEGLLGPISFVRSAEATRVIEGVVRKDRAFSVTLTLRAADGSVLGERTLDSAEPTCRDLSRSVAIVTALMLDPQALGGAINGGDDVAIASAAGSPSIVPVPGSPGPAAPGVPWPDPSGIGPAPPPGGTAACSSPPGSAPRPIRAEAVLSHEPPSIARVSQRPWGAEFVVGGATGTLPSFGGIVGAGLWHAMAPFVNFGLGIRYSGEQAASAEGKDAGGRFWMLTGLAFYCPIRVGQLDVKLLICGGVDVGLLTARGFGGDFQRSERMLFFAPGVEVHATHVVVAPWTVSVTGAIEMPLTREAFEYKGLARTFTLFQPNWITARAELGVGYEF